MLPVYTTHTWGLGISVGVCGRARLGWRLRATWFCLLMVEGPLFFVFKYLLHAMLAFGPVY